MSKSELEVFYSILYYACEFDFGRNLDMPFEERYVWEALARAVADYIGCRLPEPSYPLWWGFKSKIWRELRENLKERGKKDEFLSILYDLLDLIWCSDRLGDGDYYSYAEELYRHLGKPLQSITTLRYALARGEMKFNKKNIEILKSRDVGKRMRFYLNIQIEYIKKNYYW